MSHPKFYLCAVPTPFWQDEIEGVDIARFVDDALGCEKRITKEVNLKDENPRYTLLCQQLEREVIRSNRAQDANNEAAFQNAVRANLFPIQSCDDGYLALISLLTLTQSSISSRLGSNFFPPDQVQTHINQFIQQIAESQLQDEYVAQQRIDFFQMAQRYQCGIVELQSDFHPSASHASRIFELAEAEFTEHEQDQFLEIPEFALTGIQIESFGQKGKKQHLAKVLRGQIQTALKTGEPVTFGNQAPHDVITEVLNEFVFVPKGEAVAPVFIRIIYADGSEAQPLPLLCLPRLDNIAIQSIVPLRVALMSMRHLELDPDIDYCWFRNREVSRTRTLSETDHFCYTTTIEQLQDSLSLGDLALNLYHTGFEPAVIGFYRGVVQTLLNLQKKNRAPKLVVTPYYYRGMQNPYQSGRSWL